MGDISPVNNKKLILFLRPEAFFVRLLNAMSTHSDPKSANRKKQTPRAPNKGMVGFFATPSEKQALQDAAKDRGITVAELLRQIATGAIPLGNEEDS